MSEEDRYKKRCNLCGAVENDQPHRYAFTEGNHCLERLVTRVEQLEDQTKGLQADVTGLRNENCWLRAQLWSKLGLGPDSPAETLERWRLAGAYDPDCPGCKEVAEAVGKGKQPYDVFAPRHEVNERCESGKRPHCTCDVCW